MLCSLWNFLNYNLLTWKLSSKCQKIDTLLFHGNPDPKTFWSYDISYRAINNYLDQRSPWDFGRMSSRVWHLGSVGTVGLPDLFLCSTLPVSRSTLTVFLRTFKKSASKKTKFGKFCRNSAKQATALYVHDESFMFWSKNNFCVNIWLLSDSCLTFIS
jgi:hypothetical protein